MIEAQFLTERVPIRHRRKHGVERSLLARAGTRRVAGYVLRSDPPHLYGVTSPKVIRERMSKVPGEIMAAMPMDGASQHDTSMVFQERRLNVSDTFYWIALTGSMDSSHVVASQVTGEAGNHFLRGFKLYRGRPDKDYSLAADARKGLTEVLANDRHFKQKGSERCFASVPLGVGFETNGTALEIATCKSQISIAKFRRDMLQNMSCSRFPGSATL